MKYTAAQIAAAKQEKWYRGDLSWKLHAAQKKIKANYIKLSLGGMGKLYVGNVARQFGKSFWAVTECIELALKKPKAEIRYGSAFETDLVQFIVPAFDKVLDDCPADIKPVYTKANTTYTFPNGSRIVLVGCDKNPDALRGNTLDMVVLDECGFMKNLDYCYGSVVIPAMQHRPDGRIIMISTPPRTPAHIFTEYCITAELKGYYSKFTIYDNPMLSEQTIQELMDAVGGAETSTWRREFLCEFVVDGDLQLIPEWKDEYIQEPVRDQYYNFYHKYVAMDLGVKDFTAALFAYYDYRQTKLFIQEDFIMHGPTLTTDKLVNNIKVKEKELWGEHPVFRRVSDNNNLMLINDLNSLHQLPFIATDKDTLEAMLNELRILINSGKLVVSPKCKQLIGCLRYGVWDDKKKKFAKSKEFGHFDALAALVYLVRNLITSINPIPADFGYSNHEAWLGNIKQNMQQNAANNEVVKNLFPGLNKFKKR